MAQKKLGVREMRVVFETDAGNFDNTDAHIMNRITAELDRVKNTGLAVAFFDENGRRLRKTEFRTTPAMAKMIEEELGVEEGLTA